MQKPKISVIGLGKLGSPMVAAIASRGFEVIGLDLNQDFVEKIKRAQAPVFEPQLTEYLISNKERIFATRNYKEAILNSDITFIIVPTPSNEEGGFSTDYAVKAGREIGISLKEKSNYHLVVLTSTVVPGSTEGDFLPALEQYSGKKCGVGFGLCYNPEFIALGSVINNLLEPDFILIGESDSRSGDILESFYRDFCRSKPPIKRMSIICAEITKLALNTFVTTKISYANMLGELCERIPGGNADVVLDALGCDSRIGKKYLKSGLGYSGPCFPRDNRALVYTAKKFDVSLPLAQATDIINERQPARVAEKILSLLSLSGSAAILGLAYKTNTNVIEESQAIKIAKILLEKGRKVLVYDPWAMENAKKVLDKVIFAPSLKEAVLRADLVLIATPWEEFKNIEPAWLKREGKKLILIDCWRLLDAWKYEGLIDYFPLGSEKEKGGKI